MQQSASKLLLSRALGSTWRTSRSVATGRLHHRCCSLRAISSQPLSESTFGILDRLQHIDRPAEPPLKEVVADDAPRHSEVVDEAVLEGGRVLSTSGGVARVALQAPATFGSAVQIDGCESLGIVVGFDRQGALVACLSGQQPLVGAQARQVGSAALKMPAIDSHSPATASSPAQSRSRVKFCSPSELVVAQAPSGHLMEEETLLRLPGPPAVTSRKMVSRRLPTGLAAVEILSPLGFGQRIGLVGPPRTGKSTAARMLLSSQSKDTVCVYAGYATRERLEVLFKEDSEGKLPPTIVLHADAAAHSPAESFLVPLCAAHIAKRLSKQHSKVLLILDDIVTCADAASQLTAVPFPFSQTLTAALDMAANVDVDGEERSLTSVAVLDVDVDDELPRQIQSIWRNVEPLLDVHIGFSGKVASEGTLPGIDVDTLAVGGFAAPYQAPALRSLRSELMSKLEHRRELVYRATMRKELGFQLEIDEEEEVNSIVVQSLLLAHSHPRPLPELVILVVAALVYHFPTQRPVPSTVTRFQNQVIEAVREMHPGMWEMLCVIDSFSEEEAHQVLMDLGGLLLQYRLDFELARPVL